MRGGFTRKIVHNKEEDVIDTDDDSQLKNIPVEPISDTHRRAPQELTGVVLDDIPLNPSSQNSQQCHHIHQTHKKKVEKQKRPVNVTAFERRLTDRSCLYELGDIARFPSDMIIHTSNNKAIHSTSLLKKYFLKRSNGLWTISILTDRSLQLTKTKQRASAHWYTEWEINPATMELEESMLFVINEDGATKIVPRSH
ncbi:hypothetical protein ACHAWO_010352 [Cyclotella atomus]|uniref:Uncharacterized protein n=1 Tax=Cyclotella atomus TaxID=382360 RepID=A0ABD3NHE8_9STRA